MEESEIHSVVAQYRLRRKWVNSRNGQVGSLKDTALSQPQRLEGKQERERMEIMERRERMERMERREVDETNEDKEDKSGRSDKYDKMGKVE